MDEMDCRSWWEIGRAILCSVAIVFGASCADLPNTPPPTVEQIIAMSRTGTDAWTIVARMHDTGGVYRLSGSQLAAPKGAGVADPVLDYMQKTYLRAERERQIVDGCLLGPPYFPVN